MTKDFLENVWVKFVVVLWALGALGWIINLVLFFSLNFASPFKEEIIRGIGIVSPFGAVIGYLNIED